MSQWWHSDNSGIGDTCPVDAVRLDDRIPAILFLSLCLKVASLTVSGLYWMYFFFFLVLKTILAFIPCVLRSLQEMVPVTIYLLVILAQALAGPCTPNKAGRITQISYDLSLYLSCQKVVFYLKLVFFFFQRIKLLVLES